MTHVIVKRYGKFNRYKQKYFIIAFITALLLVACSRNLSQQTTNEEGFVAIEKALKHKFGNDAYYTDLTITHNKTIGNIIEVIVTENPESLKMGQWHLTQNSWEQTSEIRLEVPKGSKPSDFMFQLDKSINLSTLGALVETSSKQLTVEKDLENPTLHLASVKFPRNGDRSKTEYLVMLQPEHGGTTFTFSYHLNGNLKRMDY